MKSVKGIDTIKYYSNPLSDGEKNDCVVRAIAAACKATYEKTHDFCREKFHRKDRGGTFNVYNIVFHTKNILGHTFTEVGEFIEGVNDISRNQVFSYKVKGETRYGRLTIARFLAKYPKGNYFVLTCNHCFYVKDGVIYGNKNDVNKMKVRVDNIFKVEKQII